MKITNSPASTDYLFVSKHMLEPTNNMYIRVQVRMANTYTAYDFWNKPKNPGHYIDELIDQYVRGQDYNFDKIANVLKNLSEKTDLPIRFSNSMLAHQDNSTRV